MAGKKKEKQAAEDFCIDSDEEVRNFSEEELKRYFRFEAPVSELAPYDGGREDFTIDSLEITKADLEVALDVIENKLTSYDDFDTWHGFFCLTLRYTLFWDTEDVYLESVKKQGTWKEELQFIFLAIVNYILVKDAERTIDSAKKIATLCKEELATFKEGKETEKRKELSEIRREYIVDLFSAELKDGKSINEMSNEYIALYREIIPEFAEKKNPDAMEMLGYSYYGGDSAFECDWVKSRNMFLELMEAVPEKNGQWANTLGYIYYYGRANNGTPQYEEAFKYFSIGEVYGYFESTYKLADMYLNGKGVTKDEYAAFHLISRYYDENLEHFLSGEDDSKLADLALRMGSMYLKGQGVERDPKRAYEFLLIAEYAINLRMKNHDCYGDSKVKAAIDKTLSECRELVEIEDAKKMLFTIPLGSLMATVWDYVIFVELKEMKEGLKITSKRVRKTSGKLELIKLVMTDYGKAAFVDTVTDVAIKAKKYSVQSGKNSFYADKVSRENGKVYYYLLGNLVATIDCELFKLKI